MILDISTSPPESSASPHDDEPSATLVLHTATSCWSPPVVHHASSARISTTSCRRRAPHGVDHPPGFTRPPHPRPPRDDFIPNNATTSRSPISRSSDSAARLQNLIPYTSSPVNQQSASSAIRAPHSVLTDTRRKLAEYPNPHGKGPERRPLSVLTDLPLVADPLLPWTGRGQSQQPGVRTDPRPSQQPRPQDPDHVLRPAQHPYRPATALPSTPSRNHIPQSVVRDYTHS